ncbi:MAG: 2-dehydropantoate 2-reductase [Hyphomicrobiaceae bacterium]
MKILVMGSGGVGGYFGGRLAAAGHDVTFVARGAHLEAMRKDGLTLDSQIGNAVIKPARAVADAGEAEAPDVVMFATKLGDTEAAAASLKPVVKDGTVIITFQNGVDGPEIIQRVLPGADVVAGVARIASHISRPGVIEHRSPFARIEFGAWDGKPSPKLEAFHAACKAAGIDAVLSPDIKRSLWMKFAMLAPFSGLTALTGATAGPLRETPGTRALIEAAVKEVIAVGTAAGVPFKPDDFASLMKTVEGNPAAMTSSMAHDRMAGKPLEVNFLSGAVVRIGEKHGVAAPTHKFIQQALAIDAGGKTKGA